MSLSDFIQSTNRSQNCLQCPEPEHRPRYAGVRECQIDVATMAITNPDPTRPTTPVGSLYDFRPIWAWSGQIGFQPRVKPNRLVRSNAHNGSISPRPLPCPLLTSLFAYLRAVIPHCAFSADFAGFERSHKVGFSLLSVGTLLLKSFLR